MLVVAGVRCAPLSRTLSLGAESIAQPRGAVKALSATPNRRRLIPATALLLLLGTAACLFVPALVSTPSSAAALGILGAALLLPLGGFLGEAILMRVRARPQAGGPLPPRSVEGPDEDPSLDDLLRIEWTGKWSPAVCAFLASLTAGAVAVAMWHPAGPDAAHPAPQPLVGCLLIVAAFPLFVLERLWARGGGAPPGAPRQLEILLRVPLAASVGLGVSGLFRSLGYEWFYFIDRALIVLVVLISVEILLRSAARAFLPVPPLPERRSPAASSIAELITLRPTARRASASNHRQLGIDLSRSWALAFLMRASVPVVIGLIVFGWLLTGVTALGIDRRAVYERFGIPQSVEGPGLHVHLPWPLGRMRKVELGVVHEIPIVFTASDENANGELAVDERAPRNVGAEEVPPPEEDRLWDGSHPYEASYLIASAATGRQGFQIVNIDLRIVYRTSLSVQGALAAAYRLTSPETLIRAAAGRMLVQHFSRYTLAQVLGENRADFIDRFRTELQQRLDQLQSGLDILAVIVEAIHPPPEAARAYHHVQAAQIESAALVSRSRGEAYLTVGRAQQSSSTALDTAKADAAEEVDRARGAFTTFDGDHSASLRGGRAFLMERWLGHLEQDLAQSPLVIADHRLHGLDAPTVDLRRFGKSDSAPPIIPAK